MSETAFSLIYRKSSIILLDYAILLLRKLQLPILNKKYMTVKLKIVLTNKNVQ